MSVIKK